MNGDIEVVEASALDLDQVMTVMHKSFDPQHGEAWTIAQCAGVLSLPGSMLLLARSGNTILGFAMVRSVADEAELLLIAVRPDRQRCGTGEQLIAQVIARLADKGVKTLHLEVRTDNPALGFYSRLGFKKVGLRIGYYRGIDGQLTDAATLSRTIA